MTNNNFYSSVSSINQAISNKKLTCRLKKNKKTFQLLKSLWGKRLIVGFNSYNCDYYNIFLKYTRNSECVLNSISVKSKPSKFIHKKKIQSTCGNLVISNSSDKIKVCFNNKDSFGKILCKLS